MKDESGSNHPVNKRRGKVKCWEAFECNEKECPAYGSRDLGCWLFSGTHCHKKIQGKFLQKMEMCLDCRVFNANVDAAATKDTLDTVNKQFKEFGQLVKDRDKELEHIGLELSIGMSEVFEALKKISSGDPSVKIPETSKIELISKLKHIVNMTAENIGEIVDQSHEIAIGLAEHFDVLHKVAKGDLHARATGNSPVELLQALKNETNQMIESISGEITVRKHAEEALRASEERYRDLFENTTDLIQMITFDGRFLFVNNAWKNTLGYTEEDVSRLLLWDIIQSDKISHCKNILHRVLNGENIKAVEVTFMAKDGRLVEAEGNMSSFLRDNKPEYARCIFHDISTRKRMEEELRTVSLRDELTGLYNRRGLLTLAEQQLKVADRMKKGMLMLFADLDGMKKINDSLGHQEGDRALIDIAYVLKDTFRGSDIVARVGGDEFVVLALEADKTSCDLLTDNLKENLDLHNRKGERPYSLSLSIGITHYDPENPCSLDELIAGADRLMYEQKKKKIEPVPYSEGL